MLAKTFVFAALVFSIIFKAVPLAAELTQTPAPSFQRHIFTESENILPLRCVTDKRREDPFSIVIASRRADGSLGPHLYLRSLFPNGTQGISRLGLEFPDINFSNSKSSVIINRIAGNGILAIYLQSPEPNTNMTQPMAALMTAEGKLISMMVIGYKFSASAVSSMSTTLSQNVHNPDSFLFVMRDSRENTIRWFTYNIQQYAKTPNMTLTSSDSITPADNYFINSFTIITSNDGGFGMIWSANATNTIAIGVTPQAFIAVSFLRPSRRNFSSPKLLYQTQIPGTALDLDNCAQIFNGGGYACIIRISNQFGIFRFKISFLTSGSVTTMQEFIIMNNESATMGNISSPQTSTNLPATEKLVFTHLFTGGFGVLHQNATDKQVSILQIDDNGAWIKDSGLPPFGPLIRPCYGSNGTVHVFIPNPSPSPQWSMLSANLTDLYLASASVILTSPRNADKVPLNLNVVTLKYPVDIKLSTGNISVWQMTDNSDSSNDLLRQSYPGNLCSVLNNRTVTCELFDASVNIPDANYYITVENNFAQTADEDEPFKNIQPKEWFFSSASGVQNSMPSTSIPFAVALDAAGSRIFTAAQTNKNIFIDNLLDELAKYIPAHRSQLSTDYRWQFDTGISNHNSCNGHCVLLSISITGVIIPGKPSSQQLFQNLNTLIRKKKFNSLMLGNITNHLDEDFALVQTSDVLNEFKFQLIGIGAFFIFLLITSYLVHRKYPEGDKFFLVKLTLVVTNFVLKILFIVRHGNDISSLWLPSVIFLTIPFAITFPLVIGIIMRERAFNPEFASWFRRHMQATAGGTLLACLDIEALRFLTSRFAGVDALHAPFSIEVMSRIYVCGSWSVLIGDIPRLVIQIIYYRSVITYNIVALLSLIFSTLIVIYILIERSYWGITKVQRDRRLHHRKAAIISYLG